MTIPGADLLRRFVRRARRRPEPHEIARYLREYLRENDAYFEDRRPRPGWFQSRACVACGDRAGAPVWRNGNGFTYVRCRACGMVYMDPILRPEVLESSYRRSRAKGILWEIFRRNARRLDRKPDRPGPQMSDLLRWMPRGRLLDVGCGTGDFLDEARFTYESVEGVELEEVNVRFAREDRGLTVHDRPLERLPLPERGYDVVTLLQVIEHLPDPLGTLREIRRRLRPGGVLYVQCPNVEGLSFRVFGSRNLLLYGRDHVNLFSRSTIDRILAAAGFELVEFSSYNLPRDLMAEDLAFYFFRRGRFVHRWSVVPSLLGAAAEPVNALVNRAMGALCARRGSRWGSYLTAVARTAAAPAPHPAGPTREEAVPCASSA